MKSGRVRNSLRLCLAAGAALGARSAIASPVTAKPADAIPDSIGINLHVWEQGSPYYDQWQDVINLMKDMGIRAVRDHAVEVDRMNMLTDQTGIKVDAIIQHWLYRYADDSNRLDEMLANAKAMRGITWLEGPNEYSGQGDENWVNNLKWWTQELKARARNDPVLSSKTIIAPSLGFGYQEVGDLSPYVDLGNMHSYTSGGPPSNNLDFWIGVAQTVAPGRPVISTEVGWHDETNETNPQPYALAVNEYYVGKYVPRTVFEYFNRGVTNTFIYQLLDDIPDPGEAYGEAHYGLVNNDLTYKPAGRNVKNLIKLLADPGPAFTPASLDYSITGATPDVHSTLLQKRDGRFYLALWQEVKSYNNEDRHPNVIPDVPITLNLTGPMMLRRYLLDDINAPAQVSGASQFQINVPDEITLLELSIPQPGWNVNASGNWSASGNWASGVPNGIGATANLLGAIQADQTIALDSARTVATLNFWNEHRYTLNGTGPLTVQASDAWAAVNVLAGSHAIAAPIVLASNTAIDVDLPASTLTLSGEMSGTGGLTKLGAGTLQIKHARAGDLTVRQGTVKVMPNSAAAGTSKVKALSISAGATLDLTDNKLITTSAAGSWDGSACDGVTGLIRSGRLITSSATSSLTALGVARASDIGITTTAMWSGQSVSPSDTLVMYTYGGDANLDGKLNIDDYARIDQGISAGANGWSNGDFNYDGKINIDDYVVIDFNLPIQGAAFDTSSTFAPAAVPEPVTILPALAACALLRRTRRGTGL